MHVFTSVLDNFLEWVPESELQSLSIFAATDISIAILPSKNIVPIAAKSYV